MNRTVVVVPCYNEEARLDPGAFVDATTTQPGLYLLFVDDGSSDRTGQLLLSLADELGVEHASVLRLANNGGKAEAVRAGFNFVFSDAFPAGQPDAIGYWDADLSTGLEEIPRFQEELARRPEALAVIGSRVRLAGRRIERNPLRHYAGRIFATGAAIVLGFPVYDTQCGGKLFRVNRAIRDVFDRPFRTHWAFDVELLARLRSRTSRELTGTDVVVELPLRAWSEVPGSKVKLSDIPRMIVDLLRVYIDY